jgi:prepilin-type N-terminal cleavage/methylation domain-containing protein
MTLMKRRNKGFTLIEMLVSLSILAVLAGLSIASYSRISTSQDVTSAQNAVISMLESARSRSQSQVKSPNCTTSILAWWINIYFPRTVQLGTYCYDTTSGAVSSPPVSQTYILPSSVNFSGVTDNRSGGQTYPNGTYPNNPSLTIFYPVANNVWSQFNVSYQQLYPNNDGNIGFNVLKSSITLTLTNGSTSKTISIYSDGRIVADAASFITPTPNALPTGRSGGATLGPNTPTPNPLPGGR